MKTLAIFALLLALAASAIASSETAKKETEPRPIYPGSIFDGFGEAAADSIALSVFGEVTHEGCYYVKKGSTLYDLIIRIGPTGHRGDLGGIAVDVVIWPFGADRKKDGRKYHFVAMTPAELKAIVLTQDSVCWFPIRLL